MTELELDMKISNEISMSIHGNFYMQIRKEVDKYKGTDKLISITALKTIILMLSSHLAIQRALMKSNDETILNIANYVIDTAIKIEKNGGVKAEILETH